MGKPKGSKPFRICRKSVGLTYSCPKNAKENPIKSNEELLEHLEALNGPLTYIIATELHKSGQKHYHAYAKYDNEIDTRNCRYFDFKGVHPNILDGAPGNGFMKYCRKDKDFITNMDKNPFSEALKMPTLQAAMDFLWKERPNLMAINGDRIEKNIAKRMNPGNNRTDYENYLWPPMEDFKSVVLLGEPGIGKTQYALWSKHFINPLVVSHMDALKNFNPGVHDGIIFDDMDFGHLPRTTQIHLLDWDVERDIHARYGCAHIPAGTKKIFTANTWPFLEGDEAINRRASKRTLIKV